MKILYSFFVILLINLGGCSKELNQFSVDANKFLDAINGKTYNGTGEAAGTTFEVINTILSEFDKPAGKKTTALRFKNTRNNGASTTEGIYQQTRDLKQWRGIKIENNGDTLLRTPLANNESGIKWNELKKFAKKK